MRNFTPRAIEGGLTDLVDPPDDVPEDQRAFWKRWAKLAIEAGTLNERTEAGWRLLCAIEALMRRYAKTIAEQGDTFMKVTVDGSGQEHQELKAHPLVGKHLALATKVDAYMARFMLTAFGKPSPEAKQKKQPAAANPWARIVGS